MSIRVLIADDHSMVREGLRTFLGLDPELELVGEATNGEEAVQLAHRLKPDVVLMDLKMPVMDGIAATAAIRPPWAQPTCRKRSPIFTPVMPTIRR